MRIVVPSLERFTIDMPVVGFDASSREFLIWASNGQHGADTARLLAKNSSLEELSTN